jgi:hypothetical protein
MASLQKHHSTAIDVTDHHTITHAHPFPPILLAVESSTTVLGFLKERERERERNRYQEEVQYRTVEWQKGKELGPKSTNGE